MGIKMWITRITKMDKPKLKALLKRLKDLEGSLPLSETRNYLDQVIKEERGRFESSIKENPTIKYLDGFNTKLEKFKRDFNLGPIITAIEGIQADLATSKETSSKEFQKTSTDNQTKYKELATLIQSTRRDLEKLTSEEVTNLLGQIGELQGRLAYQSEDSTQKGQTIGGAVKDLEKKIDNAFKELSNEVSQRGDLTKSIDTRFRENASLVEKTAKSVADLRKDMMNIGRGGSANRQINVNSSVMSDRFTDINFVSDTAIRWVSTDDTTNKRVNIRASLISGGAAGGTP